MKRYAYKRIDTVSFNQDVEKEGGAKRSVEEILNFYCANRDSEWELSAIAFDSEGHEIIYLKKEIRW